MEVEKIELVSSWRHCELRATVKSRALREPFVLWYRLPRRYRRYIDPTNGDPFVAALLLPAMRVGEPLRIPYAASPTLLRNLGRIQAIYREWDSTLSTVEVEIPTRNGSATPPRRPAATGLFFSLGVDSFYTLLKKQQSDAAGDDAITHLIVVHGFDIYYGKWNTDLFSAVLDNAAAVARAVGKRLVPVTTNLRDLSDQFVSWGELCHGSALASTGLVLGRMLRKVYVAATHTHADFLPWGSHPLLDPLWSIESVSFLHDGAEVRRVDKIKFIARFPIVLETLRICFMNPKNAYNCGQCEKCLRTMIGLHIAGALERCRTLPQSIDCELVRSIRIQNQNERAFVEECVNALGSSETDLVIRAALEEALSRSAERHERRSSES